MGQPPPLTGRTEGETEQREAGKIPWRAWTADPPAAAATDSTDSLRLERIRYPSTRKERLAQAPYPSSILSRILIVGCAACRDGQRRQAGPPEVPRPSSIAKTATSCGWALTTPLRTNSAKFGRCSGCTNWP